MMVRNRASLPRQLDGEMKVGDLRELLEDYDDDAVVLMTCNFGDYGDTEQALPVDEVDECTGESLALTGYSRSGICLDTERVSDPELEGEETESWLDSQTIVVLRCQS